MKDFDFENSKTGILLLSHGSRLESGKKVIEAYTDMFREEFPDAIVDYAFMEIRQPDIPTVVEKLATGNDLEKLIVVPVFIAHGLHTKRDIPRILGIEVEDLDIEGSGHDHHHHHGHHHHHHDHEEKLVDFDGEIILTDPLGVEEGIFEIIKNRVKSNL